MTIIKKIFLIIIILILFPCNTFAIDKWTNLDTALQVSYITLHVIDWGQTRHISKNKDKYYEINPILGQHPSLSSVNIYFISTLITHTVIAAVLPSNLRTIWQLGGIAVEATVISNNYNLGIKVDF